MSLVFVPGTWPSRWRQLRGSDEDEGAVRLIALVLGLDGTVCGNRLVLIFGHFAFRSCVGMSVCRAVGGGRTGAAKAVELFVLLPFFLGLDAAVCGGTGILKCWHSLSARPPACPSVGLSVGGGRVGAMKRQRSCALFCTCSWFARYIVG